MAGFGDTREALVAAGVPDRQIQDVSYTDLGYDAIIYGTIPVTYSTDSGQFIMPEPRAGGNDWWSSSLSKLLWDLYRETIN